FPMEQQKHLLDCMEENGFPMAKYGFSTTIEAHPSIIASANPINSRWQNSTVVSLNEFPILSQIIQRFDLIFIFKENNQESYLRSYAERKNIIAQDFKDGKYEGNEDFLQKYLYYCKRLKPEIHQEAQKKINEFYIEMGKVGISGLPRRLDSLMRITISIAKLKLKSIADVDDAEEAITFYNEGLDDFNQAVKLADNPRDIAYQEIRKIVKLNNGIPISLTDAAEKTCESNGNIRHYLIKNADSLNDNSNINNNNKVKKLKLCNSHHLKVVMDLLRKDDCIQIVNEKPIELRWKGDGKVGAKVDEDLYGNEATESIQEYFDSSQCDVCDVYDEGKKTIEKIDKDGRAIETLTDYNKDDNNPNTSILCYDQNINDHYTSIATNLNGRLESYEGIPTVKERINQHDIDKPNNRLLINVNDSNINKNSPSSYTSHTSHNSIERNEWASKNNNEVTIEIESPGLSQPKKITEPLSQSSTYATPQIKLRHSTKAEIFTNEEDITEGISFRMNKCYSDNKTDIYTDPKAPGLPSIT
ncbi:MAG: hypothetical protein P0116_15160, partial [Candidatus Nitrosocosmicus sp.]|nr:hypothetical protein [Candidatus Nitrosocosmicus sp.]